LATECQKVSFDIKKKFLRIVAARKHIINEEESDDSFEIISNSTTKKVHIANSQASLNNWL